MRTSRTIPVLTSMPQNHAGCILDSMDNRNKNCTIAATADGQFWRVEDLQRAVQKGYGVW